MRAVLVVGLLAACGPRVQPGGPGTEPTDTLPKRKTMTSPPARQILVGIMCPDRAADRPAVSLVAGRLAGWSADAEQLEDVLERGWALDFAVLSFKGARAGVFSAAGPVELGSSAVAIGSYAGREPCQLRPNDPPEPECARVLGACGLAVAEVRAGQTEGPPDVEAGGACVEGDHLRVDLDGDGTPEAFTVSDFLDGARAPSDELSGVRDAAEAHCTPAFALPALIAGTDPKVFQGVDLLGVLDLDLDGRRELVLQYRYADKRTVAVYSAPQSAARLQLVTESEPWAE